MTPDQFCAVIEAGTPGPWKATHIGWALRNIHDGKKAALAANLAPLHNELHEAAIDLVRFLDEEIGMDKLELTRVRAAIGRLADYEVPK